MDLKIKLILFKFQTIRRFLFDNEYFLFEKRIKDLIRRFKKMQLKIYGLNLGLEPNFTHELNAQFEKEKFFENIYFNCKSLAEKYVC